MKKVIPSLLATSAIPSIVMCITFPAYAQDAGAPSPAAVESASPDPSRSKGTVTAEELLKDIVVTAKQRQIAGGLMIIQRQPEVTSSITAAAIAQKMGVAGPIQLISSVPGINYGMADPYQMSIRYTMNLRGLPMQKIGWVVDGMPPMDRAYLLPYPETYVDNENLAGLTVHSGSARITDPVQTAIAGELTMTIRDPSNEPGAQASYSYGTFRGRRIFGGFDTGLIGNTGLKAFATISETKANSFNLNPDGVSNRLHADVRVAKDWGDFAKSTLWVSYSDWFAVRSLNYSLAQFRADQKTGNYFAGNYLSTFDPLSNTNNYYRDAVYLRKNILAAWNNEIHPASNVTIKITPYYQWIHSNSEGPSSLNPNSTYSGNKKATVNTAGLFLQPNGNIPVKANTLQHEVAYGVNSTANIDISKSNRLTFGWWYDRWHMTQLNSFSPLSATGTAGDWGENALRATNGQIIAAANFRLSTNVNALSIMDSQSFLDDRLTIEAGLKYFTWRLTGTNLVPGPQSDIQARYSRWLPRATISFDIDSNTQVFGNIAAETRSLVPITTYPNIYSVATGTVSQGANFAAKPESVLGEELGFRYHNSLLTTDIALFNKKLKNNSVTSQVFVNGAGFNASVSAGGLIMRGVTAEFALQPIYGFSPYVNGTYLYTKNTTDFQVGNDYLATKGKKGVASPEFTAAVGVNYGHGPIFANFLYRYTGSQYGTFINDEKMPAYGTIDLGVGYRIPAGYVGKEPVLKLAVSNLANKAYLSVPNGFQANALTATGINGTVIAGKTVTYVLSSPRAIVATFSTKF
jgi:iron complex outermembrane receptor protein